MFLKIAEFSQKYRIAIIIFWLAVSLTLFLAAPKFSDVAVTDESQFLPQNTGSATASNLLNEKFADSIETSASSGIIVFYNPEGLTSEDTQEAKVIRDWLISDAAPGIIENVTSSFDSDLASQTLISADQTTMLMRINFSTPPLSDEAEAAVSQIREHIGLYNVQAYFTGETGLFQDLFQSIEQTIEKTTIVTIILVLLILLVIYRSPVAALLPLVAIGCSFLASMGILGFLGQAGMKFFTLAEAYLVVIIFGIGTDYCLFIVSRLREELKKNEPKIAINYSMRHIGPVITASAATVVVAFLCLSLSRFGMNKTSGYALALGIAITLAAGLTLIPALMSLFGKHLFWPFRTSKTAGNKRFGWTKIGEWVVKHPLLVSLPIIILLLVPYIAFSDFTQTNDIISQMPESKQSVQGYKLMEDHFDSGELYPVYILIESPEKNITNTDSLQSLKDIAESLKEVSGVSRIDYYASPSTQLSTMASQLRGIGDELGKGTGTENISNLANAGQELQYLVLQYPDITQSQNFLQIQVNFAEVTALSGQLPSADAASLPALMGQLQSVIYSTADNIDSLVGEFNLTVDSAFTASLRKTYFSSDGTTARINAVLTTGPYEAETIDTIDNLKQTAEKNIEASGLKGSSYFAGGESVVRADIMKTSDSDFGIVVGAAIAGILIVIIFLMRSLIAPLYMIITVLLNYGATLGITTWFFSGILNHSGMIYMLPIFIFIILVALGADYNIFLVSRIREEARQLPLKEAISKAIANTGGVITSCGIILAGTFATLTISPLQMVMQLGAAVAIGVIIDTFIVRALLVPAIATLAGRWSWWPSKFKQSPKK